MDQSILKPHYQFWGSKWSLTLIPDRLNINPDQGSWMVSIRFLLSTYTYLLTIFITIYGDFISCGSIYFETPLSVLGFEMISNFNSRSIKHKPWSGVMDGVHTFPLVNLYMSVNNIHNKIWWFHFVWNKSILKPHYQFWGSKWSRTLISDRLNINPDQESWMVSIRPLLSTYTRLLTVFITI